MNEDQIEYDSTEVNNQIYYLWRRYGSHYIKAQLYDQLYDDQCDDQYGDQYDET